MVSLKSQNGTFQHPTSPKQKSVELFDTRWYEKTEACFSLVSRHICTRESVHGLHAFGYWQILEENCSIQRQLNLFGLEQLTVVWKNSLLAVFPNDYVAIASGQCTLYCIETEKKVPFCLPVLAQSNIFRVIDDRAILTKTLGLMPVACDPNFSHISTSNDKQTIIVVTDRVSANTTVNLDLVGSITACSHTHHRSSFRHTRRN